MSSPCQVRLPELGNASDSFRATRFTAWRSKAEWAGARLGESPGWVTPMVDIQKPGKATGFRAKRLWDTSRNEANAAGSVWHGAYWNHWAAVPNMLYSLKACVIEFPIFHVHASNPKSPGSLILKRWKRMEKRSHICILFTIQQTDQDPHSQFFQDLSGVVAQLPNQS